MVPPRGSGRGRARGRGRGRGRGAPVGGPSTQSALDEASEPEAAPDTESEIIVEDNPSKPVPAAESSSQASTAVASTAASGSRGGSARGAGRLKPKAIRRGEKEREELAEAELRKQNEQAAEEARLRRENARGRGRGRGRAFARGARGGPVRGAAPTGPFSQLPPSSKPRCSRETYSTSAKILQSAVTQRPRGRAAVDLPASTPAELAVLAARLQQLAGTDQLAFTLVQRRARTSRSVVSTSLS